MAQHTPAFRTNQAYPLLLLPKNCALLSALFVIHILYALHCLPITYPIQKWRLACSFVPFLAHAALYSLVTASENEGLSAVHKKWAAKATHFVSFHQQYYKRVHASISGTYLLRSFTFPQRRIKWKWAWYPCDPVSQLALRNEPA